MSGGDFTLKPFPGTQIPEGIEIRGSINRRANILSVTFELAGNLAEIKIPAQADVPARKEGLWKNTCFEFFLAPSGFLNYWEFNISPSGDWNVYRFDTYRAGMREEDSFSDLSVRVSGDGGLLSLAAEIDLGRIIPAGLEIESAISAVVERRRGDVCCFALVHRGPKPDFHGRDGFIIRL